MAGSSRAGVASTYGSPLFGAWVFFCPARLLWGRGNLIGDSVCCRAHQEAMAVASPHPPALSGRGRVHMGRP